MKNKAKQYVVLEHLTLPDRGFRFFTSNCHYTGNHENNTHGYNGEEWYKEVGFADTIEEAQSICGEPGAPTATWDELYEYHKQKEENRMGDWIKDYFKEQWEEIKTDIDFKNYTPISTSNSLHIYEERYEIEDETYRLLYPISDDTNTPSVEILIKKDTL